MDDDLEPDKILVEPPPAAVPAPPKEGSTLTWRPWYSRCGRRKVLGLPRPEIVAAADNIGDDSPSLVLPYPPTDAEKYIYVKTRRTALYICGTFAFLALSVGSWFFSLASPEFYWFSVFCAIIQVYNILSYSIEYVGGDYDLDVHRRILQDFALPPGDEPSVEPLEILENTYKYVSQLTYTNHKVWVLDDGALPSVEALATQKYKFNYIRRPDRPHLRKAGNLRHAFTLTSGEYFVIFDADFCPRPDFLMELVPMMRRYPDAAIVQTPQFFRPCQEQTWVERGGGSVLEVFFRVVQVNRDRWGAAACVGSNALYRREALKEIGGTAAIDHSEDLHSGFQMMKRGWQVKYIPLALACGTSPDTAKAYFSQQMRWCSSSTTVVYTREFWASNLRVMQRLCFLTGLLYYNADALGIFLSPLPGMLLIYARPDLVRYYNWAFTLPSLINTVVIFPLWSRQYYTINVPFVKALQQYAHLMTIKDHLFGTFAVWVPAGDTGAKRRSGGNATKYRNMRILCFLWVYSTTGAVIAGAGFQISRGFRWYNFLPVLIFQAYTVFRTFPFIFFR